METIRDWVNTTIKKRCLVGRRLVTGFPGALDSEFAIVRLPDDPDIRFKVITRMEDGSERHVLGFSTSDGKTVELAVFATRLEAVSALNKLRRKFSGQWLSILKWIGIVCVGLFLLEAVTSPGGVSGMVGGPKSAIPGLSGNEAKMAEQLLRKYEQARRSPAAAPQAQVQQQPAAAAEVATGPSSESEAIRSFLAGKK